MSKLIGLTFFLGLSLATTSEAASINGIGDPLTDPLLITGMQQGFDTVRTGEYRTLTLGNVKYTGVDGKFTVGTDFNGEFNTTGGKSIYNDFDQVPRQFRFDFLSSVKAFAFNFGASDSQWLLQAFSSTGASLASMSINPVLGSNHGEYFGLSSGAPIAYALLTLLREDDDDEDHRSSRNDDDHDNDNGGDFVFIDRFTTKPRDSGTDVPLPAGLTLMVSGIAGMVAMRRRKKSVRQAQG